MRHKPPETYIVAVLTTNVIDEEGNYYAESLLQKIATDDPDKYVYRDGVLYAKVTYKEYLKDRLEKCNFNVSQLARELNIPRTTLRYNLIELGVINND